MGKLFLSSQRANHMIRHHVLKDSGAHSCYNVLPANVFIKQTPLVQIIRAYTTPASWEICGASLTSLGIFLSCLNECMWMDLGLASLAQPAMGSFKLNWYRKKTPELSEGLVLHSWERLSQNTKGISLLGLRFVTKMFPSNKKSHKQGKKTSMTN